MNPFKSIFDFSSKQRLILVVILFLEICGTVLLYNVFEKEEEMMIKADFSKVSKELIFAIEKEVNLNLESLNSVNSLFQVSDTITREQFKRFNTTVFDRISSIQALEWIPVVKGHERSVFETRARLDGFQDFKITERNDGTMVSASERDRYYPVYYLEPLVGNETALGYDLGSDDTRLDAIHKSCDTDETVATSRIALVQDKSRQKGLLVFSPVIKENMIEGFVLGVYKVGDLLVRALGDASHDDCNLIIYDSSAKSGDQLLAQLPGEDLSPLNDDAVIITPKDLYYSEIIPVADRKWLIICTPTELYLDSFSLFADLSLVISTILCVVFLYYIFMNFRDYNQQIENQLILESKVRERTEELEEYAHVVSHDLKSPLRTIDALTNWVKEDNKDKLDKNSLGNLNLIETTLERMELLISDILSYSSVNSKDNKIGSIDLNMVIKNLKKSFVIPKNISVKIVSSLPVIKGDAIKLEQLFQNLISNALKFIDKEDGLIEIDVLEEGSYYRFSVKDNGIGIEEKYQEQIFHIFQSLDKAEDSTGIGLAIAKKIVSQYQGEIWVESELGKGSTFYFTLKKDRYGAA